MSCHFDLLERPTRDFSWPGGVGEVRDSLVFSTENRILTVQSQHVTMSELVDRGDATLVNWRQTFDTVAHYERIAGLVAAVNEQNLDRPEAGVLRVRGVA